MSQANATPDAAQTLASELAGEVVPILDFGSQYAQLIARRVRELGVFGRTSRWTSSRQ